MKPNLTLKRSLVHRKDKRTPHDISGIIYQIICKDCTKVYTGETGRRYGIRLKEHRKDVDSVEDKRFTRVRRKESLEEYHLSGDTSIPIDFDLSLLLLLFSGMAESVLQSHRKGL